LGATGVLVGVSLLWRLAFRDGARWQVRKIAWLVVAATLTSAAVYVGLQLTETQYETRRLESNLGRYARIVIAIQAVADSPVIGYGSWAVSEQYLRAIREAEASASAQLGRRINLGDSLMPHSQLLQAWVEGGVLAAAFFCFYGWQLALGLWWLLHRHPVGALTPLYLYTVYTGLWNVAASPFLGIMRVYVALGIAVAAVLAWERRRAPRSTAAPRRAQGYVRIAR
jgi:hypothetical protein